MPCTINTKPVEPAETPMFPVTVFMSPMEHAALLPLRDAHRARHQDPHATIGDAIRAVLDAAYRNVVEGVGA